MLPHQQEGHVHVMMALVKPLIVCIWVEFELVIGEGTHCLLQSLSLESLFIPGQAKFPFFGGVRGEGAFPGMLIQDGREYPWLTP